MKTSYTLLSIQSLDDVWRWLRGDALEIVLLISGALLLIRAAPTILATFTRRAHNGAITDPEHPLGRRQLAVSRAFSWVVTALVSVVVGVLVADRFGLPLAALVPTATVIGVAVGFGAQQVVLDVVSGFFLLAERQLSIGDIVIVSPPGTTGGMEGTVEEITLRVTRLRTLEGDVVFIPNGEIRQLTNQSIEWARLVIDVPVRPADDVNHAIEVLRSTCDLMAADESWADDLLEGPDVWGVQAIDVGVIKIRIVARVPAEQQWRIARELRRRVALGFVEAGMEPVQPVVIPRGVE